MYNRHSGGLLCLSLYQIPGGTEMASLFRSTLNTRLLPTGDMRFIRSDCPEKLTEEEIEWLRQNHVTTVVD